MSPLYRAVAVEQRGGRTVFVVEHVGGRRERIYQRRRGAAWRYYSNDQRLGTRDHDMVLAVQRLMASLRGEREAQLSLYPNPTRRVRSATRAPEATVAASSSPVPGAAAGASS